MTKCAECGKATEGEHDQVYIVVRTETMHEKFKNAAGFFSERDTHVEEKKPYPLCNTCYNSRVWYA
jgi:hypothetical protein